MDQEYYKDFEGWHHLKIGIDTEGGIPTFKDRDIWWCHVGINVGHEQDGKGQDFNRPVLIIKKFNHRLFWGIPLTTQIKANPHYHHFQFKGRDQCAMLTQLRLWDAKRINRKMGRLAEKEFMAISNDLKRYLP